MSLVAETIDPQAADVMVTPGCPNTFLDQFTDGHWGAEAAIPRAQAGRVVTQAVDPNQINVIRVTPEQRFVFIIRKDNAVAVEPLTQKLSAQYHVDCGFMRSELLALYQEFTEEFKPILLEALNSYRQTEDILGGIEPPNSASSVEVHVFNPQDLERGVHAAAGAAPIISMDPLVQSGLAEFGVSRLFCVGGISCLGITHRPGFPPIEQQIRHIRDLVDQRPVCITDDDVYTGGTMSSLLKLLDLPIAKIIPQIQTGVPELLKSGRELLTPVVLYDIPDRRRVEVGDMRDFLLGCGGLVIKLPSGELGRAPYFLPFVDPSERASVPADYSGEFSYKVLELNTKFFEELHKRTGVCVTLDDLDTATTKFIQELYGIDGSTNISDLISWIKKNSDEIWNHTVRVGERQESLQRLRLPERMVLLDVNGTLIEDDALEGNIKAEARAELTEQVEQLAAFGVQVGLCSDSPLAQLRQFADGLGLNGPILAENGNIVAHHWEELVVRRISHLDALKTEISAYVPALYRRKPDVIAPEFGGHLIDTTAGEWAFGANRQTSITIFGPAELIKHISDKITDWEGVSIDCSPEHGFLGIHPGADFKSSKGDTLSMLAQHGHDILMVGNSVSDWVSPSGGVKCAFVSNAIIPCELAHSSEFVTDKPIIAGVIDILKRKVEQLRAQDAPFNSEPKF